MTLFANRIPSRFLSLPAAHKLLLGFVIGAAVFGQPSGCSRRPDLAGVYSLPASDPDDNWSIESVIELRKDGTAVMQGLSMYPAQWSENDVKVEVRSQGKWRPEGENLVYQGTLTTASTLEGEKHHSREPIRLSFTVANDGDLLLSSQDMSSDAIRYVKER